MNVPVIHVLPPTLADRIAAGEVVQRPSAAVKELIENSLDAGARTITVVLKDGGSTVVQVVDDGCGMGWDDAASAFGRHATSKISRAEDLSSIRTLGFRGEALAAIAAVAIVEMKTRLAGDETGTLVRIEGGVLKVREKTGCPPGTSIIVRNLFYNTPARRKFLRAPRTELRHIIDTVQRAALSRPDVGFTLLGDGETLLQCRPGLLGDRIVSVFGKKHAETLIRWKEGMTDGETVARNDEGIEIFLGRPKFARKGRTEQYLFLNARPIASRNLGHAVYRAYEHLLEKGSFPFFLLYLTIDPGRTDVNVHPSKLEVKFDDEGAVYRRIHAAARRALGAETGEILRPADAAGPGFPSRAAVASGFAADGRAEIPAGDPIPSFFAPQEASSPPLDAAPGGGRSGGGVVAEPGAGGLAPGCWQVHEKYIVAATPEGLMIVDQHAAHERVIYERVMRRLESREARSQELLFPETLELSPSDVSLVRELLPLLEGLGFLIRTFGPNTVILEGVPFDLRPGQESKILADVLSRFKQDEHRLRLEPRERLAITYSCRAAVKAGDRLSGPEMSSLLEQLSRTETPHVCPHGRPVMLRFTLGDLDRRFGRTS